MRHGKNVMTLGLKKNATVKRQLIMAPTMSSIAALLATSISAGNAYAQEEVTSRKPGIVDQIQVVARKRTESLQDVPIAISAFGEGELEARGANDLIDVGKFTPNLTFTTFGGGNTSTAAIFLRGVGQADHYISTDPAVGIYIDGVYLGRTIGGNLDVVNIERVEVLRGPQGTLFGKNTLGGAINVITKKPSQDDEVRISAKVGTMERLDANFYANYGITDTLSMNVMGGMKSRGGVGEFLNIPNTNLELGDEDSTFFRAALRWEASERFEVLLTGDHSESSKGLVPIYQEIVNPAGAWPSNPDWIAGRTTDPDDSNTTSTDAIEGASEVTGASLTATYEFNDNITLKGIGAYRETSYILGGDPDGTALVLAEFPDFGSSQQWSGEVQLLGEYDWGNFIIGGYYFDEKGDSNLRGRFGAFGFFAPVEQEANSIAVFSHIDINLTDKLVVSGGVRWTEDEKDFFFPRSNFVTPIDEQETWSEVTWDAAVTYSVNDNLTVYANTSTGYLSGYFNGRTPSPIDAASPVDPQFVDSYEAGFKGTFMDRLRVNAAFFYAEYTDLAVPFTNAGINGGTIIENAAAAEVKGVELEANLQATDSFSIQTAVGYIDSEVTEVQAGAVPGAATPALGDRLRLTPEWTLSVSPQYVHERADGSQIVARADYSYRSDMFFQPFNKATELMDARDILDLKLWYETPDQDWKVTLYVDNVWNEIYDNVLTENTFWGVVQHYRSTDRREVGVQVTKTF